MGGHEMAVGLTLKKDNIDKFRDKLEKIAQSQEIETIQPIIYIDSQITLKDISKEMVKSLDMLEPFGEANKRPVFLYRNLKIDSIRSLAEGKHLKLTLKDANFVLDAIGFNKGSLVNEYRIGDKIDLVGTLNINDYYSNETIQVTLIDLMRSI